MKILLIGNGGREHALAWKMAQSNNLDQLFIAPGNAGTASVGRNIDLKVSDHNAVIAFCKKEEINMVVIGPEQPLVDGLADALRAEKIGVIGPGQSGARLEGSKAFAKAFMARHNIPTAPYQAFNSEQKAAALEYLQTQGTPIVLKADGLAAGKGVIICTDHQTAKKELEAMLDGKFGDASASVVIEGFLSGIEFSVFALTDGKNYVLLPSAKDYKRVGEGDQGPNTGGMGTVSPVPFVDEALMQKVRDRIIDPTVNGLDKDGIPYQGFIFFGLINVDGDPFVIEYNSRLGDPETQVILPRLNHDLVNLFSATIDGNLKGIEPKLFDDHYVAVIMASGGYPGSYEKGKTISMEDLRKDDLVFHAGTKTEGDHLVTSGGRVLACCGKGKDLLKAREDAYRIRNCINFEGAFSRKDIGEDLMKYV
jgi:phosphoribosylamine--glycine ligase